MPFARYMVFTLFLWTFAASAAQSTAQGLGTQGLENGTYRPGTPYQTITATHAKVCESQCHGDAQCKGWNYIRLKQSNAKTGICEFNSQYVEPIASAVSISGDNISAIQSSRVQTGRTRTVRVGHISAPVPPLSKPITFKHTGKHGGATQHQTRLRQVTKQRVIREALPDTHTSASFRAASFRSDIPPQSSLPRQGTAPRLRLQHGLDTATPIYAAPQTAIIPNIAHPAQARGQLQHQLQTQVLPALQHQTYLPKQARLPAAFNRRPPELSSHQAVSPRNQTPNIYAPKPPRTEQMKTRSVYTEQPTGVHRTAHQEQLRQSFFGSLHDDVSAPRAVSSQALQDLNAPIATVQSLPTRPIKSSRLSRSLEN